MESIKLIIKGFFIGIANIIPGVSGGTLAMSLGIYEELISIISHFTSNIKKNIKYLLPLGIGAVLSILLLSKAISFSLDKFPLPTVLFFIGAILGGLPMIVKKVKHEKIKVNYILIFSIVFAVIMVLTFMKSSNMMVSFINLKILDYIKLFVIGIIAAATMVIPGVSGSAMLMTLGYYHPIINTISDLTNFSHLWKNITILAPFGIGILIGIILVAKLIEFLLKKYEIGTYYAIIAFILSSIVTIFVKTPNITFDILSVIIGILVFGIGFIIAYKLGDE